MRVITGIFLIFFAACVLVFVNLPPVTKLRNFPTVTLQQEAKSMQMKIDAVGIVGLPESGNEKNELRKEKFYYQIEIARRLLGLEWLSIAVGLFGLGLIVLNSIVKTESTRKVFKVRVSEVMPTEMYVDEGDFERRIHDAFTTKDEALMWYESDPLRVCSYCGSHSVKPPKGKKQDEIQLVTFYKKVPEGAKDLRIVLGAFWLVHPATELQCEKCQQKVMR